MIFSSNLCGADQPRYLRSNRRGRITCFLFPALLICSWATPRYEICCGFYVLSPRLAVRPAELKGKHERIGHLVHLKTAAKRATVKPGVLREAPVPFLLHFEKIIERTISRSPVSYSQECG